MSEGVTQTASVGAILGLPALGTVEGGGVSVGIHSPKFGKVPGPSRLSPFRVATTKITGELEMRRRKRPQAPPTAPEAVQDILRSISVVVSKKSAAPRCAGQESGAVMGGPQS